MKACEDSGTTRFPTVCCSPTQPAHLSGLAEAIAIAATTGTHSVHRTPTSPLATCDASPPLCWSASPRPRPPPSSSTCSSTRWSAWREGRRRPTWVRQPPEAPTARRGHNGRQQFSARPGLRCPRSSRAAAAHAGLLGHLQPAAQRSRPPGVARRNIYVMFLSLFETGSEHGLAAALDRFESCLHCERGEVRRSSRPRHTLHRRTHDPGRG